MGRIGSGWPWAVVAALAVGTGAAAQDPLDVHRLKQEAWALRESGDAGALDGLRRAATADSADAYLWRAYGRAALRDGSPTEAASALERARELGVFSRSALARDIARAWARAGRPGRALDWLEAALESRLAAPHSLAEIDDFAELRDSVRFRRLFGMERPEPRDRVEAWRRDLDYFVREAQRMHVHPARPAWSGPFLDGVAELRRRIPELDDRAIVVELRRLSVLLADGHTAVRLGADHGFHVLPVDTYLFDDGLWVIGGAGEASALVGGRVVSIGGTAVDDVLARAARWVPRDNPSGVRAGLPQVIATVPYLEALGLTDPDGATRVAVEHPDGREVAARLRSDEFRILGGLEAAAPPDPPLYLQDRGYHSMEELPGRRALYVRFTAVADERDESLGAFAERLDARLREGDLDAVIVDVRLNGGGNSFLLPPLVRALARFATADPTHETVVLTSRHTFSAAQNFVSTLEWLVEPWFVGEPTGSSPNFTGESSPTRLPWSGVNLTISTRMHMNADWEDARIWIAPHVPVRLRSADFFGGRDPVLEAALALLEVERGG